MYEYTHVFTPLEFMVVGGFATIVLLFLAAVVITLFKPRNTTLGPPKR